MKKNFIASGKIALLITSIIFSLVLAEIASQIVFSKFDNKMQRVKSLPNHYYQASNNPYLAYELKTDFFMSKKGKTVQINKYGIRDSNNEIGSLKKIGLLGDSVTFGINLSQNQTISSLLQNKIGGNAKVLNFGVPGYSLEEIYHNLVIKNEIYDVDEIIYLMNLNDFAGRDTVYEGADASLYRMYKAPMLKSPWLIRKIIHSTKKNGHKPTVEWYEWLYRGNKKNGYQALGNIISYCNDRNIKLVVVILPAGIGYMNGSYQFEQINSEIISFLDQSNIDNMDLNNEFSETYSKEINSTDHFNFSGNIRVSEKIYTYLLSEK